MPWKMPEDMEAAKKEAILEIEKPLLIIAGPGSGKTLTLVERVVYLVSTGVEPVNIFIATFTEKAAAELITRVSNRLLKLGLPVNINEMYIGTLHSIFLRLLDDRREFTRLKRNYRVLDQFEQRYLIFRRLKVFMEDEIIQKFFDGQRLGNWARAEKIVNYVNKVSEELLDIGELAKSDHPEVVAIGRMAAMYAEILEMENALDFSTIQVEAYRLLTSRPEVLAALQEQIRYFMVDEYQDTNTVQERILLLLAAKGNLCVVGDDDQGLYRFRGATVRNILEFPQNFPQGECRILKLTTNYRSHPDIIKFYNRWIGETDWSGDAGARFRFDKQIIPQEAEFPQTAAVVKIASAGTHIDFHNEILDFLTALRDGGKLTDLNQVAFLFRSVKSPRATAIAQALEDSGIPVFAPRSALFFEREEIRLILGAMIFLFPRLFEDLKWAPGVTMDVWTYYQDCKRFFADALRSDPKQHKDLLVWCQKRARYHLHLYEATDYRFSELMYELFQFPMFRQYLDTELDKNAFQLRASYNMALFSKLMTRFEYLHNIIVITPKSIKRDLQDLFNRYLNFLYQGGIEEYEDGEDIAPSGCVSFMTIHQAKGLEFPVVLVGSMEAMPRKQHTPLDELLQNQYFLKPPFEPLDRTKTFDFWRLFYTAFSRPQNVLGLIVQEETNQNGSLKIPRKQFHGVYTGLPSWRCEAFDISKLELDAVKKSNLKHEYSFTSHVLLYENCPLQYKFFKELEFASVRQSGTMAGTLIHQTIEDIHKAVLRGEEATVTDNNVSDWFEANYRSLSQAERTYLGEGQRRALLNQVLRYKARQEQDWSRIRDAEVDVSLVKEDYILKGTIDLIQGEGDTVEIIDFKSGKKPDVNAGADRQVLDRYKRQLEVYAHLVEERTGNIVSRMHLYYTAEKDGLPTISYDRNEANIEETIQSFDGVVGQIEKKIYDMAGVVKCERLCGNCDMKYFCKPEFLAIRG